MDFTRKFADKYVTISSEFRSKVFNNYDMHICASVKTSDNFSVMSRQLEFLKRYSYLKEDVSVWEGLKKLLVGRKINTDVMCCKPHKCQRKCDVLIVDHTEVYMPLEQVMLTMLNHGAKKAMGFLFFPDGFNYRKKGNFAMDTLFFDKTKESYIGKNNPVLFYTRQGLVSKQPYIVEEYEKFFKTSVVVHDRKSYCFEIVNRTLSLLFYNLVYNGPFNPTADLPRPRSFTEMHIQKWCLSDQRIYWFVEIFPILRKSKFLF